MRTYTEEIVIPSKETIICDCCKTDCGDSQARAVINVNDHRMVLGQLCRHTHSIDMCDACYAELTEKLIEMNAPTD